MADSQSSTINAGISVLILAVFALIGSAIVTQGTLTQQLDIDNETEWNNYADTLSATEVTADGLVQLQTDNTSGSYTSVALDSNESDAHRYVVAANIADEDNSSVDLTVGSSTNTLQDGVNKIDFDSGASTFELAFSRDSTSVTSPQVDSVMSYSGDSGLLGLLAGFAFALMLILGLVKAIGIQRLERASGM